MVLAHGFTQNTRCWGRFGRALASVAEVVLVDAPGHGQSNHDNADLWTSAELLTEVGGRGVYVGYSMGGRTALHAALSTPDLIQGLVLIGATAGLDDTRQRANRRDADEALARKLTTHGLPRFLDDWLRLPLFAGLSEAQAAKQERLKNRPEGLAASLRNCGTGTQEPLWDRLAALTMPVLVVVGDRDHKFTELGHRLVAAMSSTSAELVSVPGTHAVHLERPDQTAAAILERIVNW